MNQSKDNKKPQDAPLPVLEKIRLVVVVLFIGTGMAWTVWRLFHPQIKSMLEYFGVAAQQ